MPDPFPFTVSLSDYGHLDVRFIKDGVRPQNDDGYETRRWLHEKPVDHYYHTHDYRYGVYAEVLRLQIPWWTALGRLAITGLLTRTKLWVGPESISGELLFGYPSDSWRYFAPGVPHQRPRINITDDPWSLQPQSPMPANPEEYPAPAVWDWSVSGAPAPGTEIDPGRWHVWHGELDTNSP